MKSKCMYESIHYGVALVRGVKKEKRKRERKTMRKEYTEITSNLRERSTMI
jgi:hypothetical protein